MHRPDLSDVGVDYGRGFYGVTELTSARHPTPPSPPRFPPRGGRAAVTLGPWGVCCTLSLYSDTHYANHTGGMMNGEHH